MSNNPSRLLGLLRAGGLFLVATGGPALALAALPDLRANPWVAALVVLLYELLVVAIGFLSSVLRNLHEQWATRVAEAFDAWFQRRISTYTGKYLRYVVAATRYLDVKGLSTQGEYTLEMSDVLVRLSLVPTPVHRLSPDPIGISALREDASTEGSVWEWLRRAQRDRSVLAIIGPPGSGKTTLLRHVAYTLARGGRATWRLDAPRRIPILVNLREHKEWSADSPPRLVEIIRRSLTAMERPEPPSWVEANLRRGNFLIMLDGLDEMPDSGIRSSLSAWVEQQASSQSGNILVITSRPFGYRDNPVNGATVVEVQRFSDTQISAFVNQWYMAISVRSHGAANESARLAAKAGARDLLSRLDETTKIAEITGNPLLLTMIANVHHYRGALPGSRSELYQEICEVFLGKRHQARGVAVDLPSRRKQAVLRVLAYEMMRKEVSEVSANQACSWVEEPLAKVADKLSPAEFLRGVEESSGLLIEKERGRFSFAHLTFQEFLAADHIREQGKLVDLLSELGSAWWRETILLYAAVADATPIVEACLHRANEPAIVALAVQCVEEAREVTAEMRSLLNDVVNPADARKNPVSRRAATQVRLLLRRQKDMALRRNKFIARSEVTCLEYQCFLDSTGRSRAPDHWKASIFPAGMEDEPIVGIRYEDAQAFCEWMKSESADPAEIRLPRIDELEMAMQRESFSSHPGRYQYWSLTEQPGMRDAGFSVLLRSAVQGRRQDPYPKNQNDLAFDAYREMALSDAAHASEPHKRLDIVREFLLPKWRETKSCDIGQARRQLAVAEQLVFQYMSYQRPLGLASELQHCLLDEVASLRDQASKALGRNAAARRGKAPLQEARRRLRVTALNCAFLASALFVQHGGGNTLRPSGWVPRPTIRVPRPSALPTVMTNALAHAFLGLHADFALLEARLSKVLEATEALVYVRQFDATSSESIQSSAVKPIRRTTWTRAKPFIERPIAAFSLLLMAPLLLLIAVAIKIDSRGPVLFHQPRVGLGGKVFDFYKFRTMVVDADAMLAELLSRPETDGLLFKMRDDPRVTRVGKALRRYSLDELPSLVNVLSGSMSFVGPRPALPSEVARYDERTGLRLAVRPGLTGLWQVSGGTDLGWDEGLQLDILYAEDGSLRTDLLILLRASATVIAGRGAY